MENITFNELLSIIEDKDLNLTWCDHDNWTVKRALDYIEELSVLYPSGIRIIKDYENVIEIYYKDKVIQRYIIAG
ncbi:hypothetical protein O6P32_01750 [Phocaeicola sp. KGMB11183]|jgi:hypothetical protein|uniref:Uncharacterized protein n=1 Tax=Phocaeicola acetigenes TaxID=3016083 RepID=A0ABT4PEF8_9BACT|nr:hypothetical protein [Phocaeicola sp. KGMB11183]MCZ8371430.1 hypothetical protein [Phocaeicola sp. KGMB11183]